MPMKGRHRKRIDPELYIHLIRQALPIPPETEEDDHRLVEILSGLDERNDLSPEEKTFAELLTIVIENFEDKHYALPKVAPHEALRALMEDRSLQHRDIAEVIGNKGLTTEILAGRRQISKAVARRLSDRLSVPVEIFL
jgi:HTH-type transcriptional regulator/antitoxin HigA